MTDAASGLTIEVRAAAKTMRDSLVDGDCVIFLGAGAAFDKSKPHLPGGNDLSAELAEACGLKWHQYVPLATTAFFYESIYSRAGLHRFLRQKILNDKISPSGTIEAVAELAFNLEQRGKAVFIVTTNYDQMFEQAYRTLTGKEVNVIKYRGAVSPLDRGAVLHDGLSTGIGKVPTYWRPRPKRTYLYKLHGCITEADSNKPAVVITEEDYVNFLANAMHGTEDRRVLSEVQSRMASFTTLFIGYSLNDWNFRVLFKATAESTGEQQSYAIQVHSDADEKDEMERQRWNAAVTFWKPKGVTVLNCDALTFVRYLLEQVDAPVTA